MTGALFAVAVLLAAPPHVDTTVAASPGDVVVVEGLQGELLVEAWSRDVMAIEREGRDEAGVAVRRTGNRIRIRPDERRGNRPMELILRLPAGVELEVQTQSLEVTVRGVRSAVSVHNLSGDVELSAIGGSVEVYTLEGEVRLADIDGSVRVEAQADDVHLRNIDGDVWVTSGAGDIDLLDIAANRVFAEALSGDVTFRGGVRQGGRYEFSSHSGDLDISIPRDTEADVTVATFDGEFESEFPVTLRGLSPGGTFEFTLGGGGATLAIRAFDGEILLRRNGGAQAPSQ